MADQLSKTRICNMAIVLLGGAWEQETLQSYDDDTTKAARLCRIMYPQTVDEVLRGHPWNCALVRKDLGAALSDTPAFGYDYQYQLPTNPHCLRVLQMEDLEDEWRREGDKLLTDETDVKILYIKRITDATEFEPLLVEAIYTKLASKLAVSLASDEPLSKRLLEQYYKIVLPMARSMDAQECSVQELETTTFKESRL